MTAWYWLFGLAAGVAAVAFILKVRRSRVKNNNESETYPFW
jgi:hypothetical protein